MLDDHLKTWSDKVLGHKRSFRVGIIDPLWTQRYAVAVNDLNPLYFNEDYARKQGYSGIIAPPNYLATLRDDQVAGPLEAELLTDGTRPDGRPDVPGLQIMGGGQELEFHAPIYCGVEIFGEKSIVKIDMQQGRSGPMVIVEEEIRYWDMGKNLKLILKNRSLYRVVVEERGNDGD